MGIGRSNRSGVQLREPSDFQPEHRLARLSFRLDDPHDVQGIRIAGGLLDGEVRWEDLVCVAVDDRHGDAQIRQPNLDSVVNSR